MQSHDAEFSEHGRTPYPPGEKLAIDSLTSPKVERPKAKVILFKKGGKYYTEEEWEIPTREEVVERGGMGGDSVGPYCMKFSKDFRRIGGDGHVLVETQEPWGYPHLIPAI
jgi:hypothetical protein